ncbi:MAG: energy-coupling factor transporter ATPase [Bacilli bacterium]|nr:energy-coupling factor transporter ATPase [Bacilli bacterium]MBR0033966.1 energy-coupling factor transporter ATPase [Bacilli bacterium]MBR0194402.1 energy-coupling factor transporter ATPase [Bacilli bacterium]
MKIIEVNHLSYKYNETDVAINDVSFSIDAGKYVAIIGHNGSGKSTFAKLLMGLLEPNENSIKEFGITLDKKSVHELRNRMGIVFQNPDNQFVGATVRDDLAFGLENRCIKREDMDAIINEYAEKVNMVEFLDKEPENLSGGQKQRVAIAGVLSMNPEIVIFDEATAMLDPKGKREIRETILKMKRENPNMTILSITHDIEEAYQADEVIAFNDGKVVFQGKPEEVLKDEKQLQDIGLDIPFVVSLRNKLEARGIKVDGKTVEEVVEQL